MSSFFLTPVGLGSSSSSSQGSDSISLRKKHQAIHNSGASLSPKAPVDQFVSHSSSAAEKEKALDNSILDNLLMPDFLEEPADATSSSAAPVVPASSSSSAPSTSSSAAAPSITQSATQTKQQVAATARKSEMAQKKAAVLKQLTQCKAAGTPYPTSTQLAKDYGISKFTAGDWLNQFDANRSKQGSKTEHPGKAACQADYLAGLKEPMAVATQKYGANERTIRRWRNEVETIKTARLEQDTANPFRATVPSSAAASSTAVLEQLTQCKSAATSSPSSTQPAQDHDISNSTSSDLLGDAVTEWQAATKARKAELTQKKADALAKLAQCKAAGIPYPSTRKLAKNYGIALETANNWLNQFDAKRPKQGSKTELPGKKACQADYLAGITEPMAVATQKYGAHERTIRRWRDEVETIKKAQLEQGTANPFATAENPNNNPT